VFVHGSDDPNAMTDGRRAASNDVFYARLGQRIIHMLTTRTPSGILYEVDMRLRPNGNSGLLVTSLKAFERYQLEDAWTWEHQALVRARAVVGDPAVMEGFNTVRQTVLCRERDVAKLQTDVAEMRNKMADSLDRSNEELFDVKQGRGGLVDIEFLVQYGVLRWAHRHPGLTEWTDNARLLQRLGEYGLIDAALTEQLFSAYRVYRAIVHRRALQEETALIPRGELQEERAMVLDIWRGVMEQDV
jgi:glutamate-ammonia-ligase adenylyltransferase